MEATALQTNQKYVNFKWGGVWKYPIQVDNHALWRYKILFQNLSVCDSFLWSIGQGRSRGYQNKSGYCQKFL